IGLTLAALLGSQMIGDRLRSVISQSFTDNASVVGSRQNAVSDRSGDLLNSDGAMYGVTLRRTRVYDAQGLQEPKSVLWKTPKLFTPDPGLTFADRVILMGAVSARDLVRHATTYHGALSVITTDKEAYLDYGYLFLIDLQTGKTKNRFRLNTG